MDTRNISLRSWRIFRLDGTFTQVRSLLLLREIFFRALIYSVAACAWTWLVSALSYSLFDPTRSQDDWQKLIFQLSVIAIPFIRTASLVRRFGPSYLSSRFDPVLDHELRDALCNTRVPAEILDSLHGFYKPRWTAVVLRSRLEGALCQFFILLWIAAQLFQNDGLIAFTGVIGLGMFLAWTNSNHKREQYTDKMGALDLASRTLWAPPSAVAV